MNPNQPNSTEIQPQTDQAATKETLTFNQREALIEFLKNLDQHTTEKN